MSVPIESFNKIFIYVCYGFSERPYTSSTLPMYLAIGIKFLLSYLYMYIHMCVWPHWKPSTVLGGVALYVDNVMLIVYVCVCACLYRNSSVSSSV